MIGRWVNNEFGLVGIATGYELDGWGSIPDRGKRFFPTPQRPGRHWDPPSLVSNEYPGIKQPGRDADHSLLSNAETKKGKAIIPLVHTSS
jgi:hypothetical protein